LRTLDVVDRSVRRLPRALVRCVGLALPVFAALNLVSLATESVVVVLFVGVLAFGLAYALVATVVAAADVDDRAARPPAPATALLRRERPILASVVVGSLVASVASALGLLLLVVPGLVLATRWSLLVPVLVVERVEWRAGLGRSAGLVAGHGWPVFGVLLCLGIPYYAIAIGLAGLGSFAYWASVSILDTIWCVLGAVAAVEMYVRLRRG
jgi:hypothetical protein